MLLQELFVTEKLMSIDDDVDMIYDRYFKEDFEKIAASGLMDFDMFATAKTDTSVLQSDLAKQAHALNPCTITINLLGGNFYRPTENLINITINQNALNVIMDFGDGSIEKTLKRLDTSQAARLSREFKPSTIKGSINHELVHWIDDTLHNSFITQRVQRANLAGRGGERFLSKRGVPVNADTMEIQSQVHNVLQLKRQHADVWDELTFTEMIRLSPALSTVYFDLLREPYKTQWKKALKQRLYREGLLGKSMR